MAANNCASVGVVPAHTVNVPFTPAFGLGCSVTVTVAVVLPVHGAVAFTVYVHTLAFWLQVPPASGDPPKLANSSAFDAVLPAHIVRVPFVPAFGVVIQQEPTLIL